MEGIEAPLVSVDDLAHLRFERTVRPLQGESAEEAAEAAAALQRQLGPLAAAPHEFTSRCLRRWG
jgi:hypothetical protein